MGSDGVGCKVMTGITGEPHCFVAGTSVSTEDGQRAVEEVEAGDKVWDYDEETGEKELKEVFVSETDKLIHVETDREEIVTTELCGRAWICTGRMPKGRVQSHHIIQDKWAEKMF